MASSSTGRFFSREPRPANTSRRVSSSAEFLAQPRIAVAWMEGDQVDAQRLYMHVGDAQAHQLFRHYPAGARTRSKWPYSLLT